MRSAQWAPPNRLSEQLTDVEIKKDESVRKLEQLLGESKTGEDTRTE